MYYHCSPRFFSIMDHVCGSKAIGIAKGATFDDRPADFT
jgi:hypothetical protein